MEDILSHGVQSYEAQYLALDYSPDPLTMSLAYYTDSDKPELDKGVLQAQQHLVTGQIRENIGNQIEAYRKSNMIDY